MTNQEDQTKGCCAQCSAVATLKCTNCKQVYYCDKKCQKDHWGKEHKRNCKPVKVIEDKTMGRCLMATRDIKAGQMIFKEQPLVVGPKQITKPICLSCYKRVDGQYRCQGCTWPLCGPACETSYDHQSECSVGKQMGSPIDIRNFKETNHFYEVVTPLRCLMMKIRSPEKYKQIMNLESHYEDRKRTDIYTENHKRIVNMLRNYFMLLSADGEIDCSEVTIHKITGILDVNAVDVRDDSGNVIGLYATFSMIEHSCVPNIRCFFDHNRRLTVRAAIDIKAGDRLTTCYTEMLWGTFARREQLKLKRYFMCMCKRCADPTELGVNFSTIRCQECPMGFMTSAAPLDETAQWFCNKCNATVPVRSIKETTLEVGNVAEKLLTNPTIPALEAFVNKFSATTVGDNHFSLLLAYKTLASVYGENQEMTEAIIVKKENVCKKFLDICKVLDPGMAHLSYSVATVLYEQHKAMLARVQKSTASGQKADKKQLSQIKGILQTAVDILIHEVQPYEVEFREAIQQNIHELDSWINSAQ